MALLKYLKVPKIKISALTKYIENEPLRILFCGSDAFSIASLEKLHRQHEVNKSMIASIDVVCRPGKPVGRGLKTVRHVPISETAKELGLPLHEIDTFTGWEPPKPQGMPINLIVAVSFGLFVPPRILGAAKYGGLNVHPSMLPDFYGPAPLHHTLLSDSSYTGVTVQTMDSRHFDRGTKLLQHPHPGIRHNCRSVEELSQLLATKGGNMLVDCIRNHLYLYGSSLAGSSHAVPKHTADDSQYNIRHASKLTAADRFIDWTAWTGKEIRRRHRVLGPLWSLAKDDDDSQALRRIIWSDGFQTLSHQPGSDPPVVAPVGQPIVTGYPSRSRTVLVKTCDGEFLRISRMKIEGGNEAEPLKSAIKARMNAPNIIGTDGSLFRTQILPTLPDQYREARESSPRPTHIMQKT